MKRFKGIKVFLVLSEHERELLKEFTNRQGKLNRYASKVMQKLLRKNIEVDVLVKKKVFEPIQKAVRFSNETVLLSGSARWVKRYSQIELLKKQLGLPYSDNVRCATYLSARLYKGVQRRFKHLKKGEFYIPRNPAMPKLAKSLYLQGNMFKKVFTNNGSVSVIDTKHRSGLVDVDGLKIEMNLHDKNKFVVPIRIPKRQAHLLKFLKYDKKQLYCDTNLIQNKKGDFQIVLKVTEEFEPQYEPVKAIGIDMNKRKDCFITLSENYGKIPLTDKHLIMVDDIKQANSEIKTYEGRKRTKRKKWFAKGRKLFHSFTREVNKIITLAISEKALLAIDGIALAETGTFGHSEFLKALIKEAERRNIPFVVVETPNTSKDCYNCLITTGKYQVTARHKDFADAICPKCFTKFDADVNAANNIAYDGWQVYSTGKNPRKSTKEVKRPQQSYDKVEKQYRLIHDIPFM